MSRNYEAELAKVRTDIISHTSAIIRLEYQIARTKNAGYRFGLMHEQQAHENTIRDLRNTELLFESLINPQGETK